MRRAFLVNSDKCIGCRGCAMACKSFNQLEPERFWRYVYPLDKEIYPHEERAFYSLACNHCENPACGGLSGRGVHQTRGWCCGA